MSTVNGTTIDFSKLTHNTRWSNAITPWGEHSFPCGSLNVSGFIFTANLTAAVLLPGSNSNASVTFSFRDSTVFNDTTMKTVICEGNSTAIAWISLSSYIDNHTFAARYAVQPLWSYAHGTSYECNFNTFHFDDHSSTSLALDIAGIRAEAFLKNTTMFSDGERWSGICA